MKPLLHRLSALIFGLSLALPVSGRVINIDFSRDISGLNPGNNQADALATSPGIDVALNGVFRAFNPATTTSFSVSRPLAMNPRSPCSLRHATNPQPDMKHTTIALTAAFGLTLVLSGPGKEPPFR